MPIRVLGMSDSVRIGSAFFVSSCIRQPHKTKPLPMYPTQARRFLRPTRPLSKAKKPSSKPKYPRPRPGTAERPPYRAPDPLVDNPKALVTELEDGKMTFVHRPPPTMEGPESVGLSKSPLLRGWRSGSSSSNNSANITGPNSESTLLPPEIRRPSSSSTPSPLPRLSDEALSQLKELRRSDPKAYTRSKLAEQFGCTSAFVGMVAPLKGSQCKAAHKALNEKHEKARERWSERHAVVTAVRAKRKELW